MNSITIPRPDDWHCHLRQADWLPTTLQGSSAYRHVVAMPNLKDPITTIEKLNKYREEINQVATNHPAPKQILYTMFCHDGLDKANLALAKQDPDFLAVKLYPASVTTNSQLGISDLSKLDAILDAMQQLDIPLMVHAEVPDLDCDPFDRESYFIERYLVPWSFHFPALRISVEHLTTKNAVDFVSGSSDRVAASITPHHLFHNRRALFQGGINPHFYCLPLLKRQEDMLALRNAATSGNPSFYAGTDSAPHLVHDKESACGCAGIYNAPFSIQRYAELFISQGKTKNLANFLSCNGANFYQKPISDESLVLSWDDAHIPHPDLLESNLEQSANNLVPAVPNDASTLKNPTAQVQTWGVNSWVKAS